MTMDDVSLNITCDEEYQKSKTETAVKSKAERNTVQTKRKSWFSSTESGDKSKKQKFVHHDGRKDSKGLYFSDSSGIVSSLFAKNPEIPVYEVTDVNTVKEKLFSSKLFSEMKNIHPFMVSNLEQTFGISKVTTVQKLSIPKLLKGKDALIRSQTGSGKTLAYAIPIVQQLQEIRPKLSRADGVRALIILPTNELALQTYECFLKLVKSFAWIVPGLLVGGEKRKAEKARIRRGINILIGTPGRLLDHSRKTKCLQFSTVQWLILDEGDKLLELGYEKDISRLVEIVEAHRRDYSRLLELPRRQTVLLSATMSPKVAELAGLTLYNPVHIDASRMENLQSEENLIVPKSLSQKFIITPAKLRLVTLAAFIFKKCELEDSCKILVFMGTQDMVDYHMELLSLVLSKTAKFFKLHGRMLHSERGEVFNSFRCSESGVLFCTDVAARGLDLPKVDWIIQYTAPISPEEYVHRVGRTARVGMKGSALLFLVPQEMTLLEILRSKHVKLEEEDMNYCLESLVAAKFDSINKPKKGWDLESAATELQMNFEQAVLQQKMLYDLACAAFQSWARFYSSYPKKFQHIYNFKTIHLGHFAKSFALRDAPSAISGIKKPYGNDVKKFMKKAKKTSNVQTMSRAKHLIMSEFDSGL